jgi:hypothetical protein
MRLSMLIGAGLLAAAAAYIWFRGPSRQQEAMEDVVDLDAEASALLEHAAADQLA